MLLHEYFFNQRFLVNLNPDEPIRLTAVHPQAYVVSPDDPEMLRSVICDAPVSMLPDLIQLAAMRLMGTAAAKAGKR